MKQGRCSESEFIPAKAPDERPESSAAVYFDLRAVMPGIAGGLYQYLQGLLPAFQRIAHDTKTVICATPEQRDCWQHLASPCCNIVALPLRLSLTKTVASQADPSESVIFRAFPTDEEPHTTPSQWVSLIPDMQHEAHPEFFPGGALRDRRRSFNLALSCSDAIVTLSPFSRRAILNHPWTHCRNIYVCSPSVADCQDENEASDASFAGSETFFYYPANLWPHKNHERILEAFRIFVAATHAPVSFVFTGHDAGWKELRDRFRDLPIRHLGFVPHDVVLRLMKSSIAVVFFSLYEGFGMPLLEAFRAGAPVLCSDTSCLPETAGDACLKGSPTNPAEMAHLLRQIYEDAELRKLLIIKGMERLKSFSWDLSAQELKKALTSVRTTSADTRHTVEILAQPPALSFTIVTEAIGSPDLIAQTAKSIATQSYPNCEFLVANPTTPTSIVKGEHQPLVHVDHSTQSATAVAMNQAFSRSQGAVRLHLRPGETLVPGALMAVSAFLKASPQIDVCVGDVWARQDGTGYCPVVTSKEYEFESLMNGVPRSAAAVFWRTRVKSLAGELDVAINDLYEYDYWVRAERLGARFAFLNAHLADFHPQDESYQETASITKCRDAIRICERHTGTVGPGLFAPIWACILRQKHGPRSTDYGCLPRTLGRMHHLFHQFRRHGVLATFKAIRFKPAFRHSN